MAALQHFPVGSRQQSNVMAGLVPAIDALPFHSKKGVDARHKAGHDEL